MASEAEQAAQGEGLGAFGGALPAEGGEALGEDLLEAGEDAGRVFFSVGAGG